MDEIFKALPLRGAITLHCVNESEDHRPTLAAESFESIASMRCAEDAATDAAEELLDRARRLGWWFSSDRFEVKCPGCCAGQGGG